MSCVCGGGLQADSVNPHEGKDISAALPPRRTCSQKLPIETSLSIKGGINIHKAGRRETRD